MKRISKIELEDTLEEYLKYRLTDNGNTTKTKFIAVYFTASLSLSSIIFSILNKNNVTETPIAKILNKSSNRAFTNSIIFYIVFYLIHNDSVQKY